MSLVMQIGPEIILSYRRLSYTPWHAIAEFIDNSTQAYINNKALLDSLYESENEKLTVTIIYQDDYMQIKDNAIGMSYENLINALRLGVPTMNSSGRSKYGMGLKTAACWIGNKWSIRTKKYGEKHEYKIEVDVQRIAEGETQLPVEISDSAKNEHYTIIEITSHNQRFRGRTINTIKQYLSSMYRQDFRSDALLLFWNSEILNWIELDNKLLSDPEKNNYKQSFDFIIDGKIISGWIGILKHGSRRDAGFTILQANRVIKGWPEAWRPKSLYGPLGSNDLVNQRLLGEIHLDGFEVSHTKDDILWREDEEEKVEAALFEKAKFYREMALEYRKRGDDQRGPSEREKIIAIDAIDKELRSEVIADLISDGETI
jgi:hypothetical protein